MHPQLTENDLSSLVDQVARLNDLEAALNLAQYAYTCKPSDLLNAWIMGLRIEQARRAGKLRVSPDALLKLWPQIARYRDDLVRSGIDAQIIVGEVNHAVNVTIIVNGKEANH